MSNKHLGSKNYEIFIPVVLSGFIFFALGLHSWALIGIGWDELWDFHGVNDAFSAASSFFNGETFDSFTFDLKWFGNATRWPFYLFWRFLLQFPWRDLSGINPDAFILASGYIKLNHLNAIVFAFFGVCATSFWAYNLFGKRTCILSFVLLLLLPTWMGHGWMNSKDIPFASAYTLYSIGCSFLCLSRERILFLGAAHLSRTQLGSIFRLIGISLMVGSRISSLIFVLVTEIILFFVSRKDASRRTQLISLIGALLIAFCLTPQAWSEPLSYPAQAISFIASRQAVSGPYVVVNYLFTNFYDLIPLSIVLGLVCFVLVSPFSSPYFGRPFIPLLLQVFLSPILLILGGKSIYNELRHILFIWPPITICAAFGVTRLCWLLRCSGRTNSAALLQILFCLVLTWQSVELISLSPYQYAYRGELSRLTSLLSGESHGWRSDYWGLSNLETIDSCLRDKGCANRIQSEKLVVADSYNQDLLRSLSSLYHPSSSLSAQWSPQKGGLAFSLDSTSNPKCLTLASTERPSYFPVPSTTTFSRVISCPYLVGVD